MLPCHLKSRECKVLKTRKLILLFVLLAAYSSGCALALAEKALGDKKATHASDQSTETGGNQGYLNN